MVGRIGSILGEPDNLTSQMVNSRFGRLLVIKYYGRGSFKEVLWLCLCDCGEETLANTSQLKNGGKKSCGCFRREFRGEGSTSHGLSNTRIYNIWIGIKSRCYNQNVENYQYYGGRGIVICDEWLNDFRSFYDWAMANGYQDHLTIERIDNNGNYAPNNCRWATHTEQVRNRNYTRLDEDTVRKIREDLRPSKDIASEFGVSKTTVLNVRNRTSWSDID